MNRTEGQIQAQVLLEASRLGLRVFRNHTGRVQDKRNQWHNFGLCKGSSDIIGITPCGRFVAIEVKRFGGRATKEQESFIDMVSSRGGFACIIDDEKKLEEIYKKWLDNSQQV